MWHKRGKKKKRLCALPRRQVRGNHTTSAIPLRAASLWHEPPRQPIDHGSRIHQPVDRLDFLGYFYSVICLFRQVWVALALILSWCFSSKNCPGEGSERAENQGPKGASHPSPKGKGAVQEENTVPLIDRNHGKDMQKPKSKTAVSISVCLASSMRLCLDNTSRL